MQSWLDIASTLPCPTDAVECRQNRPQIVPIHVDVFPPGRMVIAVVRGAFTTDDVRARNDARPRGPLAFVVSPGQAADNAEAFARLTADLRPVKVFHSLHAARKWLDEKARPQA